MIYSMLWLETGSGKCTKLSFSKRLPTFCIAVSNIDESHVTIWMKINQISLELGPGVSLLHVCVPYPCVTLDITSLKSLPNKTLPGTVHM
jgi:hypothetical protein